MSTKIYDGVQIKYMDYIELCNFIKEMRKELIPIAQAELMKVKAKMLEAAIAYFETGVQLDVSIQNWNKLKELQGQPLQDIRYFIEREVIMMAKKNASTDTLMDYNSEVDMDVKLSVMPIPRKLLGIRYIKNEALDKAFMAYPGITEYGYWNNVDAPKGMSNDSWKRRKKNWNIALPGVGIPAENGFEFSIIDTLRNANEWISNYETQIIPNLTPKDELRTKIAKMKLLGIKFEEFKAEMESDDDSLRVYFKARDYVKEHPDDVESLKKDINLDVELIIREEIARDHA